MAIFRNYPLLAVFLALAACAGLPNGGPTGSAILEGNLPKPESKRSLSDYPDYDVVEVTPKVLSALNRNEPKGFIGTFGNGWAISDAKIGVGDVVAVTIYEATNGGLFGNGNPENLGANSATLPPQPVDSSGRISVPYAGRVKAAGRTPAQVQASIVGALAEKAIEPQAIVTVTQNASRFVTVSGEVGQGGRFPITTNGDRILDAVASAGGPRDAAYQIYIRLTRGKKSSVMKFSDLVAKPSENVHLSPGDQVFLYRNPQSFTVLGALARNANIEFDKEQISLGEALGKSAGLIDQRSDPKGVFVFRIESAATRNAVVPNSVPVDNHGGKFPVVYRVDLHDARGLFMSQAFNIRDKDIVYVSNAPATDLGKFLQLLGSGVGVAGSTAGTLTVLTP